MRGLMFKPWKVKAIGESPIGTVWQTRRVIKPQPETGFRVRMGVNIGVLEEDKNTLPRHQQYIKPRYHPGEIVYLKEPAEILDNGTEWIASYDDVCEKVVHPPRWFISRHIIDNPYQYTARTMPAWAARYFVKILKVRAERVQEISEDDANLEGCKADIVEVWWQGYQEWDLRDGRTDLLHQQVMGECPPKWMIEPHRMQDRPDLRRNARDWYRPVWNSINKPPFDWQSNPYVWVYEFERVKKGI